MFPTTDKPPHDRTHFLSSPVSSCLFLSGDMQCSKFLNTFSNICINLGMYTIYKQSQDQNMLFFLLLKCRETKENE